MSSPLNPGAPANPFQQVWDDAAKLAAKGAPLQDIVTSVVDSAGPGLDQEARRSIPARGRTFWASLSKAVVWGIAADVSLLVVGSFTAHPVPLLKVGLCVGIMIWAVAFGVMAANHKVRVRRIRAIATKRAQAERVAKEAALQVWASQVPGNWQPLGPAADAATASSNRSHPNPVSANRPGFSRANADRANENSLPTAWLRRFGVAAGEAVGSLVDGTEGGLRSAIKAARGLPTVLFVPEPGYYTDDARSLADELGVALFVVGPARLLSMSHAASAALKSYRDPTSTDGPVHDLLTSWAAAAPVRASQL